MVRLSRFELETHCLEGSCSIHLSYRRINSFDRPADGCPNTFLVEAAQISLHLTSRVGAVRFELTAPWSQTKCATAALRPDPGHYSNVICAAPWFQTKCATALR